MGIRQSVKPCGRDAPQANGRNKLRSREVRELNSFEARRAATRENLNPVVIWVLVGVALHGLGLFRRERWCCQM